MQRCVSKVTRTLQPNLSCSLALLDVWISTVAGAVLFTELCVLRLLLCSNEEMHSVLWFSLRGYRFDLYEWFQVIFHVVDTSIYFYTLYILFLVPRILLIPSGVQLILRLKTWGHCFPLSRGSELMSPDLHILLLAGCIL